MRTLRVAPPRSGVSGDAEVPGVYGRTVVGAVLALFVCRLFLANAVVPPWQGPDEPTHFALAKRFAQPDLSVADIERQTLQSMARHEWWRFYQEPLPDPLPQAFSEVPEHLTSGNADQPVYYLIAAALLRAIDAGDVEAQYAALRWLSMALALLTLVAGWLGTRAMFGDVIALATIAIAALHPQFLLSSISVNPDAFINLCGAVVWWQVALLLTAPDRSRARALVAIAVAAAAATFSKRNGLPLALVAIVSTPFALRSAPLGRRALVRIAAGVALFGLLCAAALYVATQQWESLDRLVGFWLVGVTPRRPPGSVTIPGVLQFLGYAIDTSWLYAGWLRFPAPDAWLWIARVVTIGGLLGAAAATLKPGAMRRPMLIAWIFVGLYAGTLLPAAFASASVPQGRYLFGALIPGLVLICIGWSHALRQAAWAPVVPVILAVMLDSTGFVLVLLRAYAV